MTGPALPEAPMEALLVEALGAYRTNDAGLIAALMLVLTIAAFTALPPLIGRLGRARA